MSDPTEKFERLIAEARVAARGAQCRRCNTDDPHRVIGFVTGLCKECERQAFDDGFGAALAKSVLARKSNTASVAVPPRHAMAQTVPLAWEWKHNVGAVASVPIAAAVVDPIRGWSGLPDDLAGPPPRPDGFSQAAVDAAKAVLLAPVAKRSGR